VTLRVPTEVDVTYGRLTVIGDAPSRNGERFLLCRCSCGTEKELDRNSVRRGRTKSCTFTRNVTELGCPDCLEEDDCEPLAETPVPEKKGKQRR